MAKVLKLYNTFTKSLNNVELNGKLVATATRNSGPQQTINGSFYICGPTVYSDCHVGHAITYIRADLFRRFMKSIFNVRLNTVMNITDIDDKILERSRELYPQEFNSSDCNPLNHPFNKVSNKYYHAFQRDLKAINVLPADIYVKVSKHIDLVINFIRKLERDGFAYVAENGDVYFDVKSVTNYKDRFDLRFQSDSKLDKHKRDSRDFALWKAAKLNEPIWYYKSSINEHLTIPGRPGWHVQCSAISSAIFGDQLDFHFGGKDLVFPHHYNEEACCCAYYNLNTQTSIHVWVKNWLHSGHLVIKDAKMSKSLGNVITINSFIGRSSVNALRLLCIDSHYRSDTTYDEDLFKKLKALDHKLNAFNSFLVEELRDRQYSLSSNNEHVFNDNSDLEEKINMTQEDIIEGICDDFHLDKGLESILGLSKYVYSRDIKSLRSKDLIVLWSIFREWCQVCGLNYGRSFATTDSSSKKTDATADDEVLLKMLLEFRDQVRNWTLDEMKKKERDKSSLMNLMEKCDKLRSELNEVGFVARDGKSGS